GSAVNGLGQVIPEIEGVVEPAVGCHRCPIAGSVEGIVTGLAFGPAGVCVGEGRVVVPRAGPRQRVLKLKAATQPLIEPYLERIVLGLRVSDLELDSVPVRTHARFLSSPERTTVGQCLRGSSGIAFRCPDEIDAA